MVNATSVPGGGGGGNGTGGGQCTKTSPFYQGAVGGAVQSVIDDDKGRSIIFDHNDKPYGLPKVKNGVAYHDAVIAKLTASGYKACASCNSYEEVSIRRPSDNFDEYYDIYTSTGYVRNTFYIGTCSPPVSTAGMAAADPAFTFDAAANPTIPITGMAGDVCWQFEPDNGPAVRLKVKVFHIICNNKESTTVKVGCSIIIDATPKNSRGQATNAHSSVTWSCTGPFNLGRDTCFNPRGKVEAEGTITCTGRLDNGVSGSVSFGAGASDIGITQIVNFTADLCTGDSFAGSNPTCNITNIPQEWKTTGGNKTIYCRVKDEGGLYSEMVRNTTVLVDINPPVSIITSPEPGSAQTSSFVVRITDSDDVALDKCYYLVNSNLTFREPRPPANFTTSGRVVIINRTDLINMSTLRECNKPITIRIGPSGHCKDHGNCDVNVFATDKAGNIGIPFQRNFSAKLVYTNITLPPDGTYQTFDFNVQADDTNIFNANDSEMRCLYDVFNISVYGNARTVSNVPRACNGAFQVTIGPDGNCNVLGQGACKVVAKINTTINGKEVVEKSERFYGIDWVSPLSEIVESPDGWQNSDFTIKVIDYPQASVITDCQYKVISNATETVRWTSRPCSTIDSDGAAVPAELTITVGAGRNCRHESGSACKIYVRPLGRNSVPGLNDSVTVAIILDGNVTDTNGFSLVGHAMTKKGLNFTGTLRQELRAATFYVCNANSPVARCIAAYTNGDRGQDKPNFCGSVMFGTTGRCDLRCNDREVSYYFVGKGQTLSGPVKTNIVVSPVETSSCPTFRIAEINEYLRIFTELDESLSIQIMMTDQLIQDYGETETANNETLAILQEALMLTRDHLDYMYSAMRDLDTDVAEQIIFRSEARLDEINAVLNRLASPTRVYLFVDMPGFVRYETTSAVPLRVVKTGPRAAYGRTYCVITKPGAYVIRNSTGCMSLPASYSIQFGADRIGTWSYSCVLGRSIRSDCSYEVNTTPVTGTFQVLPGRPGYIEAVNAPATAIVKQSVMVNALMFNPDDIDKYANVRCDFKDPTGYVQKNASACVRVPPTDRTTATIYMNVGERLGVWEVSQCTMLGSTAAGCPGASLENVSNEIREFSVIYPTDVYIESVSKPTQVVNGTQTEIKGKVKNPTTTPAYVEFACTMTNPAGTVTLTDRRPVDINYTVDFSLAVNASVPGIWTIQNCKTSKTSSPDYSGLTETYALENLGAFEVTLGTKLTFISKSLPTGAAVGTNATVNFVVRNPSLARYAQVRCDYRDPLNNLLASSSQCVHVNEGAQVTVPMKVFVDRTGTWNIETCNLYGSLNEDCSAASLHDTMQSVGSFNSPGGVGVTSVAPHELFIESTSVASHAYNGTKTNVIVNVRNTNTANSTYVTTGCTVVNPLGGAGRLSGACRLLPAASRAVFALPQVLGVPGTWTVRDCFVNGSSMNNCVYSVLYNVSADVKQIAVDVPTDLYVLSVNAPDADVANNTDVRVDGVAENPTSDDKFGAVSCTISDPNGKEYTKTTACVPVPAGTSKQFNVTVFANVVGTWIVDSCSVASSSNSACGSPVTTGELINGDTFNVVRGYNLLFSALDVEQPVYNGAPAKVAYTVSNPSTAERFARVRCTAARGNSTVTNSTGCFSMSRESFSSSVLLMPVNFLGTWSLTCNVERSFDSLCSSPVTDDTKTRIFDVTTPPDLFIQALEGPSVVPKDKRFETVVKVRNLGLQKWYAYVGCDFKNYVNETSTNTSTCDDVSKDTNSLIISFTPDYKGIWNISNCYVRGSVNSDCTSSRVHNVSTLSKIVTASVPILTIERVRPSATSLLLGDVLDIAVEVKNNDERDHNGFVNCTVVNPRGVKFKLTSALQTIQFGQIKTFHPQKVVDIAGTWTLESCGAYRVDSPPVLDDSESLNQTFVVTTPPPVELCSDILPCRSGYDCVNGECVLQGACSKSNCPGTKAACYCAGDRCIGCGTGYTCTNAKCVIESPIVTSCRTSSDCITGQNCVNGFCTSDAAQCFVSGDCPSGMECKNGVCTTSSIISQEVINLLIIILSAISVPIILFIYIKRVI